MFDCKTKRSPALPTVPSQAEWEKFEQIVKWRRSCLEVFAQHHQDTFDDIRDIASRLSPTINLFPWEMDVDAGNWAASTTANQLFNGCFVNTSANANDALVANLFLAQGVYEWNMVCVTEGNSAIASLMVGSDAVANVDLYSANTVYNSIKTTSNIEIGETGNFCVYVKALSKNANSNSYYMYLTQMSLRRVS